MARGCDRSRSRLSIKKQLRAKVPPEEAAVAAGVGAAVSRAVFLLRCCASLMMTGHAAFGITRLQAAAPEVRLRVFFAVLLGVEVLLLVNPVVGL